MPIPFQAALCGRLFYLPDLPLIFDIYTDPFWAYWCAGLYSWCQ